MTNTIDPIVRPITGAVSKVTFGTVGGDKDPFARVLQIDKASIDKREDAIKKSKQPAPDPFAGERAATLAADAKLASDTEATRLRRAAKADANAKLFADGEEGEVTGLGTTGRQASRSSRRTSASARKLVSG